MATLLGMSPSGTQLAVNYVAQPILSEATAYACHKIESFDCPLLLSYFQYLVIEGKIGTISMARNFEKTVACIAFMRSLDLLIINDQNCFLGEFSCPVPVKEFLYHTFTDMNIRFPNGLDAGFASLTKFLRSPSSVSISGKVLLEAFFNRVVIACPHNCEGVDLLIPIAFPPKNHPKDEPFDPHPTRMSAIFLK